MWAGLLATASQQTDSVLPSFVETMKQFTPNEARFLDKLCNKTGAIENHKIKNPLRIDPRVFASSWRTPARSSLETLERLGLIQRQFNVSLAEA